MSSARRVTVDGVAGVFLSVDDAALLASAAGAPDTCDCRWKGDGPNSKPFSGMASGETSITPATCRL